MRWALGWRRTVLDVLTLFGALALGLAIGLAVYLLGTR